MKDMCLHGYGDYKHAWMQIGGSLHYKKGFRAELEISDIEGYVPGDRPRLALTWRGLSAMLQTLRGETEDCDCEGVAIEHLVENESGYLISTDDKHGIKIDQCSALALTLVIERLIVMCAIEVDLK